MRKLNEGRKIRSTLFKKQSEHIGKVLERYEKEEKLRENRKLEGIKGRINAINRKQKEREREREVEEGKEGEERNSACQIFGLTQEMQVQSRCMSNSLDLECFRFNKYKKINELCE